MCRYKKLFLLFLLSTVSIFVATAQDEDDFPEFIHQNKLYKTGSSWFTIGSGLGYFPLLNSKQTNFSVDLNSRWKKHYFTLGFHYDGDEFITIRSGQRYYEFHAGYGWRNERYTLM